MKDVMQDEICLNMVQQYKEKDVRYVLLRLRFRRTVRFLIYVENHGECAMESIEMEPSRMRECFARLVKGRLAPCHLKDWIHDEMTLTYV